MSKLSEFIKDFKESDIKELPKKWFIETNEENLEFLNNYLIENKEKWKGYHPLWKTTLNAFFYSEERYVGDGHSIIIGIKDLKYNEARKLNLEGYTQITNNDIL